MEYKRYNKNIKVNGHSIVAEIVVEVNEDDAQDLLDQDFENEGQRAKYVAKIEHGDIFAGCIIVTASAEGIEGFDSLGACELKSNNMFNSEPFNNSVESYLKEYSMEKIALDDLKRSLTEEYDRLLSQSEAMKLTAEKYRVYSAK
jgi:hypothetical protein